MTEKMMRRTGEKMLAIPRAKHRIMHTTPVLKEHCQICVSLATGQEPEISEALHGDQGPIRHLATMPLFCITVEARTGLGGNIQKK
jgi:hypothetical protein